MADALALEERLSAYLDGAVDEAERAALERLVARDEEARRLLDRLKTGTAFGRTALDGFLNDPVPLSLVRRIRQGVDVSPRNERVVGAPKRKRSKLWPKLLGASFGMLLVGGLAGYLIGSTVDDRAPLADIGGVDARSWLDDIAAMHRIYVRQQRHLVEVPGGERDEVRAWLTGSTGIPFAVPDLTRSGLTFQGGRLLVVEGQPTGQLFYRDTTGDLFAVYFLKIGMADSQGRVSETMRDDLAMISWATPAGSFAVVGPSAAARLRQLADTVSDAM
ncbi:anti-sigma factor family protein [Rhizobium sp. YIM 134829]|uniref:anti-sigma factor family protein n=1 Tax=Rhizobium sp. YIM 134829 TaxID=3390453 RepID=UPI00397AEB1A